MLALASYFLLSFVLNCDCNLFAGKKSFNFFKKQDKKLKKKKKHKRARSVGELEEARIIRREERLYDER